METRSIEFFCPKCGSSTYGSSTDIDGREETRKYHCTGERYSCNFTWSNEDFWRYSQLVIRKNFASIEEYKLFERY